MLNFSNLDQAFILGSNQIKDTQEEIANLKKLIIETNTQTKKKPPISSQEQESPYNITPNINQSVNVKPVDFPPNYQNYMRIGPRNNVSANFANGNNGNVVNSDDLMLLKLINGPKFDDIVKSYVLMNHPEWVTNGINSNSGLVETNYSGGNFIPSVSHFGNKYSTSACSVVQKYIIFFISCIIIFLVLSIYLDKKI